MKRKKIAILGGGLGALSTAYALTSRPFWKRHYDITVYQLGWRLGGKCASSRQESIGNRSLEHGLHVWLGCYHNAFRMLRDCYVHANWDEKSSLGTVDAALNRQDEVPCMDYLDGHWYYWPLKYPRHPGTPGDGFLGFDSLWDHAKAALQSLLHHNRKYRELQGLSDSDDSLRAMHDYAISMPKKASRHKPKHEQQLLDLLRTSRDAHHELVSRHPPKDPLLHRLWVMLDLGIAMLRGLIADKLLTRGLESINDQEFRRWLKSHGAHQKSVDSGIVRELYDAGFSYREGLTGTGIGRNQGNAELAAGTALFCALQVGINYSGSVCYEMNAGMGEVVIAPLYEALKEAGIKFEFFSDVKKLSLDDNASNVEKIVIGQQVELIDGAYEPLDYHPQNGIPAWPDHPFERQIKDGSALKGVNLESTWSGWQDKGEIVLERGKDFDQAVLAISIAALPDICEDFTEGSGPLAEKWHAMFESVKTTQTQAAQLWFNRPLESTGWDDGAVPVDAGPEPYDVWAELGNVLQTESWPDDGPKSLHYLCGPLTGDYNLIPRDDPNVPQLARKRATDELAYWLENSAHAMWPALQNADGNFDWDVLYDPENRVGKDRLNAQYVRVNIDSTERYVLSLPDSSQHRMTAGGTLLDNLVVAGDWTQTPFNAGNVEAAVTSGLNAGIAVADRTESFLYRLLGNTEAFLWRHGLWSRR